MIELQLNPQADDQKLLAQVIDFYQRTLKESPDALAYLRKRGINNPDCIEQFRIGYANRSLGSTLPNCDHKAGKQIRTRLQELHILRPDSGHEHFNGSVVFPIHSPDGTGRIVDIYGRKTGNKLRKGTAMDTFMASDRQGVWNFHGFGVKDEVILCESLFDALLLWCHGYRNVTCMFGNDALTDDLWRAFREFGIRRVVTTSETIAPKILDGGMDCFLLRFPSGLSANEYAKQFEDPAAALGAVIRKAEWLGKGKKAGANKAEPMPTVEAAVLPDEGLGISSDQVAPALPGVANATPMPAVPSTTPTEATASVMPDVPQEIEPEQSDDQRDEVVLNIGHRRYRVRGMAKNLSYDRKTKGTLYFYSLSTI